MEMYKTLMEINRKEMAGEEITDTEKEQAVNLFLNGVCGREEILKYKRRMRVNAETDTTYPNYYIPPYADGKKLRLVQGYLPKTYILYANHYELEIIRLLYMFAPENDTVKEMVQNTLQRLKNTCFGNSCTKGECLATGISVLRFLAKTKPYDVEWIDRVLEPLGELYVDGGNGQATMRKDVPMPYFQMVLKEIDSPKAKELLRQKEAV